MKALVFTGLMLYVAQNTFANCIYEGKEFPESSNVQMISSIKECRQGRWEKIKITKSDDACLYGDSPYPENTIIKYAKQFRICKIKKDGYEWEIAKLSDAPTTTHKKD